MKAIIKNQSLNYDYYNTYVIIIDDTTNVDVKVSANVYKIAKSINCYDVEINDTEIDYYVNNKKTVYNGYKKLYTNLYGEAEFSKHEKQIEETAIGEFINGLQDKPLLRNLTPTKATKYIKRLLKLEQQYPTLKTTIIENDKEKEITYTSNYLIAQLAKLIHEDYVFKKDCQYTNGTTSRLHLITNVSSFLK